MQLYSGSQVQASNAALLRELSAWNIFDGRSNGLPEMRKYLCLYSKTEGIPFRDLDTPYAATKAILHSMIGMSAEKQVLRTLLTFVLGHYIMLSCGFLHRDVSDGIVLGVRNTSYDPLPEDRRIFKEYVAFVPVVSR